jgi:hypothetical protein
MIHQPSASQQLALHEPLIPECRLKARLKGAEGRAGGVWTHPPPPTKTEARQGLGPGTNGNSIPAAAQHLRIRTSQHELLSQYQGWYEQRLSAGCLVVASSQSPLRG